MTTLFIVLSEHPGPVGVLLVIVAALLLNRYGAWPRFSQPTVTPRTPEQEARDNQRIVDIRAAAARVRAQYDENDRPRIQPIVVFEKERDHLTTVQRRIRLEQREKRA